MELTLDLACKYKNAKIITDKFICKVIGIDFENESYILRATNGVISDAFVIPIKECKLILKQLSSITENELIKIANKAHGEIKETEFTKNDDITFDCYWDNKNYTIYITNSTLDIVGASTKTQNKIEEQTFKSNFDLNDLIENNIAIDENLL